MREIADKGWEGPPLDTDSVEPRGIAQITVELDAGEEVLTPEVNEQFGAYDLYEASRYLSYLSNQIREGSVTR